MEYMVICVLSPFVKWTLVIGAGVIVGAVVAGIIAVSGAVVAGAIVAKTVAFVVGTAVGIGAGTYLHDLLFQGGNVNEEEKEEEAKPFVPVERIPLEFQIPPDGKPFECDIKVGSEPIHKIRCVDSQQFEREVKDYLRSLDTNGKKYTLILPGDFGDTQQSDFRRWKKEILDADTSFGENT